MNKTYICDECDEKFTYPYFVYEHNMMGCSSIILRVCNPCFCENSTLWIPGESKNIPKRDYVCHNPVVSTIYCFEELEVYNSIVDSHVWVDLIQYMK